MSAISWPNTPRWWCLPLHSLHMYTVSCSCRASSDLIWAFFLTYSLAQRQQFSMLFVWHPENKNIQHGNSTGEWHRLIEILFCNAILDYNAYQTTLLLSRKYEADVTESLKQIFGLQSKCGYNTCLPWHVSVTSVRSVTIRVVWSCPISAEQTTAIATGLILMRYCWYRGMFSGVQPDMCL